MENMSLSDIAAVTRGNDDGDGWGGNGAWWIIVLFLFMFGAGWNRGGGANGEPVTEAGLCNAMNFNNPRPWTAWLRSKCLSTRTSRSNGRWRARF